MSFLDIASAAANTPPKTMNLRPMLSTVILAENAACWDEMEVYTMGKRIDGSKQFDQHAAVLILLRHDMLHGGHITAVMKDNATVTHQYLWRQLVAVLGTWLTIERGVVRGLLTQQKVTDDVS